MGLQEWWDELPPVTKFLFAGSMIFTLAGAFGLISPQYLIFHPGLVYYRFEVLLYHEDLLML